jgi:CheY-like chemotaxis protein
VSANRVGRAGLPDLSGRTILVVDDTEDALELLSGYLTACGARVLAAANGVAALTYLATDVHIDVVVSDLTMPHMDGLQLLRWIRATEGRRSVPVVALTGYPERYVQTDARFDVFLEKPVDLDRLCEVIRTIVENSKDAGAASQQVPQRRAG